MIRKTIDVLNQRIESLEKRLSQKGKTISKLKQEIKFYKGASLDDIENRYENKIKELESAIKDEIMYNEQLKDENDSLKAEISELVLSLSESITINKKDI